MRRPRWFTDYESKRKEDFHESFPTLGDPLEVKLWAWEDGESLLEDARGNGVDLNVLDYPEYFEQVDAPTVLVRGGRWPSEMNPRELAEHLKRY